MGPKIDPRWPQYRSKTIFDSIFFRLRFCLRSGSVLGVFLIAFWAPKSTQVDPWGPKMPQVPPKTHPRPPKTSQRCPKTPQERSKMPARCSQTTPNCAKMPPRPPFSPCLSFYVLHFVFSLSLSRSCSFVSLLSFLSSLLFTPSST